MKVIAINGSPRKTGNTATLLQNALEGAASVGAETELIHLADLTFTGCISCFACKRKTGTPGKCAVKDGLSPVLEKIMHGDALILGSPIYLADVTAYLRALTERLIFMNLSYDCYGESYFEGRINSAFIYTMNVPAEHAPLYQSIYDANAAAFKYLNGSTEFLLSCDTFQYDDYSLYRAANFDAAHKAEVRATQFPEDCKKAFETGARLGRRE